MCDFFAIACTELDSQAENRLRVRRFRDIRETSGVFYETEPEKVGQTRREIRADLFRVHLLRGGGLIARGLIDSYSHSRERGRWWPAAMELLMREL
jgi:hypothetical protein